MTLDELLEALIKAKTRGVRGTAKLVLQDNHPGACFDCTPWIAEDIKPDFSETSTNQVNFIFDD